MCLVGVVVVVDCCDGVMCGGLDVCVCLFW